MSTMMLKSIIPFPIFAPLAPLSTAASPANSSHSTTEVRFSRWNNANAEEFNRRRRTQQQIEDDIRCNRRFQSAENIVNIFDSDNPSPASTSTRTNTYFVDRNPRFRSVGTPSTPSSPSIPGKKSKYSKPQIQRATSQISHPAFQKPKMKPIPQLGKVEQDTAALAKAVKISKDRVSYVVPDAPFEYMYSYTETPKAKPLALREPPVTPFGPGTMPRPWTGRKPLPPSKKKLPQFDSFVAPPNKKGIKPVQKPGPFLPGSGPKYVWSREEILGDPLTQEEVKEMVESCRKTKRQLNMGRDGFTHNMLENIHAHWKRRRVCKIKCKGVCTVDMDNVCEQLEEKTGGKIVYRKGGSLYLFRGRNYNYKTRPRYPLMLWKPVTPVYPKLIKQVPDGLTYEEASEMRAKGRQLIPICRLAKNGAYDKLVDIVREAFEACELVRIDCQGLNGSDYRRIGAKLKDIVPCVLISFEMEHILLWRGREWKSSLLQPLDNKKSNNATFTREGFIDLSSSTDQTVVSPLSKYRQETMSVSSEEEVEVLGAIDGTLNLSLDLVSVETFNSSEDESRLSTIEDEDESLVENSTYEQASDEVGAMSPVTDTYEPSSDEIVGTVSPVDNTCKQSSEEVGALSPVTNSCGPSSDEVAGPSSSLVNNSYEQSADEVGGAVLSPPVMNVSINSSSTIHVNESVSASGQLEKEEDGNIPALSGSGQDGNAITNAEENGSDGPSTSTSSPHFQQVESLLRQAVESGTALILDDSVQEDADAVYRKSAAFARHAPLMPEYKRKARKVGSLQKSEGQELVNGGGGHEVEEEEEFVPALETQVKSSSRTLKKKGFPKDYGGVSPQGSLGVDELAKLLA